MATNEIRQTVVIEAELRKIQQDLKTLEGDFRGSFARIQSVANSALGAFGIGLGTAALTAFASKVVDVGDQLSDLNEQTGLSIEILGGIKPVLDSSNSSLDGFAKGFAKFQKGIGEQSKDVVAALKAIKLDPADIANALPDEALEKLVKALASVENGNERLAIANRLLSRSSAELIPTILQLAENGIPKLDKATADAYRTLGQFKDQLAFASADLINFAAKLIEPYIRLTQFTTAFLNLRQLSNEEKFGKFAADIDTFTAAVSRSTGLAVGKIEGMSNEALNQMAKTSDAATRIAIDNLVKTRQAFDKVKPPAPPSQGAFNNLLASVDDSKIKKLESALQSYRDSLIKTITTQEIETIKLTLGEQAALKASQAYQVLALRASLAADKIPIPPEVQKAAAEAEATLKSLGVNVQILGEKNFAALQSGALAGAAAIDQLKQSMESGLAAVQAFADAANEGVGPQILNREDVARQFENLKRLSDQFRDLQKTLAIEILPEDQQGAARAGQEFEERIKAINEWRDAAIAAGKDVATVNAEAAQATADAWTAASQKMKEEVDEATEFTRRAIERGFDAVSDLIEDTLNFDFKKPEDFLKKIQRTLNSLIADQFTLQLKEIVLGPDFGKKKGDNQVGGFLGPILEALGLQKPKAPPQQLPGTTPADVLDAEFGQQLAALAPATQQFSASTIQFGAAVQQFSAAAALTGATGAVPPGDQQGGGLPTPGAGGFDVAGPEMQKIQRMLGMGGSNPMFPDNGCCGLNKDVLGGTLAKLSETSMEAIKRAWTAGEQALRTLSETIEAGFDSLTDMAVQAIESAVNAAEASAASSGGDSGGMSSIPFIGQFMDMFSGGGSGGGVMDAGAASEGGGLVSSMGYHRGGKVTRGGEFATFKRAIPRFHSGGEVPAFLKPNEFVLNDWSASRIGKPRLDYMNATGKIPMEWSNGAGGGRGARPITVNQYITTQDAASFMSSQRAIKRKLRGGMREF